MNIKKYGKFSIYHFDEIDSTNLYLRESYNSLDEFSVITSDYQSKGRGRLGRTWHTNKDNIAISILLKPKVINNDIARISLVVGASVYKTINKYKKCMIKWPNDILIDGKKVSGILLEAVSAPPINALIIGIGININQMIFEDDIKNKATSLKLLCNKEIDKDEVLLSLLDNFYDLYNKFLQGNDEYIEIVRNNSYLTGRKAFINNREVQIIDINDDGTLKICFNGTIENVNSGEVTLEKIYQ